MRRNRRRRFRYRPGNRRKLRALRAALSVIAAAAVLLSVRVIVQSLKTSALNRQLNALHTADGEAPSAEIAAPALGGAGRDVGTFKTAGSPLTLARMGLPDGSPIEARAEAVDLASTAFHNTTGDVLPDMLKLLRRNPDTVGWLYIDGMVSLPVVYRDNAYYLTHDFDGHHSASGTLFLDEAHPLSAGAQNLLIHGHSMNDGSMFGLLTHYQKLDSLKAHPLISFSTLWEKERYAVFAVLKVSSIPGDPDYFDYAGHPGFVSAAAFDAYLREVQARSLFRIPVDVKPTDALLTLSTCLDDDRLVILARKLRPGETRDELISAAETAT